MTTYLIHERADLHNARHYSVLCWTLVLDIFGAGGEHSPTTPMMFAIMLAVFHHGVITTAVMSQCQWNFLAEHIAVVRYIMNDITDCHFSSRYMKSIY